MTIRLYGTAWTDEFRRSALLMLSGDEQLSFRQSSTSTQRSWNWLIASDDLIPLHGRVAREARRAANVLNVWDRQADADSRGAVLFASWAEAIDFDNVC